MGPSPDRMRAALEQALSDHPDDDATLMAYADHLTDAGDPRGNDRHVCGGYHRIAAARHVAADRVHRDVAVP